MIINKMWHELNLSVRHWDRRRPVAVKILTKISTPISIWCIGTGGHLFAFTQHLTLVLSRWSERNLNNLSLSMYIGRTHWMPKVFKKACEKYSSRQARCFGRTRLTSACISCVGTIREYTNRHELNWCGMCEAQNKNHMKYVLLERDCGHSVPVKMRKFSAMHLGAFPHCPALIYSEVWNTRSPGAPTSSLAIQTPNPPDPTLLIADRLKHRL